MATDCATYKELSLNIDDTVMETVCNLVTRLVESSKDKVFNLTNNIKIENIRKQIEFRWVQKQYTKAETIILNQITPYYKQNNYSDSKFEQLTMSIDSLKIQIQKTSTDLDKTSLPELYNLYRSATELLIEASSVQASVEKDQKGDGNQMTDAEKAVHIGGIFGMIIEISDQTSRDVIKFVFQTVNTYNENTKYVK